MERLVSGEGLSGPWVVVQEGVYRYSVTRATRGVLVRSAIWEYLATEVFWGEGGESDSPWG